MLDFDYRAIAAPMQKESNADFILRLQTRILEQEDLQERLEASAVNAVQIAEDLEMARLEAEEYQKTIQQMALFDPLTGVANRNLFDQKFEDALQSAQREDTLVAILLLDLDKFKSINDSFGHPIGDELLIYVSEKLKEETRETDTVARLGGDEFAIILTHLDRDERAARVAERIVNSLADPVTLSGSLIKTGASIGISLFPRDGESKDELLRKGDAALYAVKQRGRGNFQFFDLSIDAAAKAAHILENELRLAIVRKEFILAYQPQLNANGSDVSGAEALLRWNHPVRGVLPPFEFIEFAESSGLIVEIGQWILKEACRQRKEWYDVEPSDFRIAVNISPVQFSNAAFLQMVKAALEESGLRPEFLEIEITESLMLNDIENVAAVLRELQALGVSTSIDDFGTGYSSLAYLKRLPRQKLKIDKSFVDNLADDNDDLAIVEAVVRLGHTLGLDVIAEGVESIDQANALNSMGCDEFQGYLYSKPLMPDDFSEWLAKRN